MTRAQRLFVIIALPTLAIVLHVVLFNWSIKQELGDRIFTTFFCNRHEDFECMTIWYDSIVAGNYVFATFAGIFGPICLIAIAIYMAMGLAKSE